MCSYCGCESIEVVGRFMAEHVGIVNASGTLGRACAGPDPARVADAVDALADLLHPHTTAEERGLFALLAEDTEFSHHVASLCAEHAGLDAALARIRAGDHASYPAFDRSLRLHIDREENGLFPAAAIAFAGPEWELVLARTPAAAGP